ncbi:peptidase M23 [Arthrobacter sp. 7749]|nr:peptidase M23 [Arthrobacter sp. 7749]
MRGNHLIQQHNSGHRRAPSTTDASPADGSLEQILDTALNGENTSSRSGRRALGAGQNSLETTETSQYGGRRFGAGPRYAASPAEATIAATEIHPAATAQPVSLAKSADADKLNTAPKSAPRAQRPRFGLVYKLAAVAAVTGLAFAAAPAQESEGIVAEPERVAHTSVADVSAPANDKLSVDRASVTSKFVEVKKVVPAPVTTAAEKVTVKDDKAASTTTAAGSEITKTPVAGELAQPVDSIRLTSRFGYRKNPTAAGYMNHNGLDYAVPLGTPVKASAAGTVVQAEWAGHSGYRVEIDHGNGLHTSYNHNSSLKVSVGQKVNVGDVVSLSGSTGNSTGPHLHLEVIVNGQWVNPESWL